MTVSDKGVVDLVGLDPISGEVLLVMVEHRSWGSRGELLPDLEDKFELYLHFSTDGQLLEKYPEAAGKPIRFELRSLEPLGRREEEFVSIVTRQHLEPAGIAFTAALLPPATIN